MEESSNEVKIKVIIKEVMAREEVEPKDVPEEEPFNEDKFIADLKEKCNWSHRYFRGRAYGQFECDKELCDNSWPSAHASCVLDLKNQEMVKKFKQECGQTHIAMEQLDLNDESTPSKAEDGVEPFYSDESMKRMVEWAVDLFLQLMGRRERKPPRNDDNYQPTPEHRKKLCELCKRGLLCAPRAEL